MIRLLRRWADTRTRAEVERLRLAVERERHGRQIQAELTARWRSIATDRGIELAEMKKEQNQ